ncbi:hypothetical protein Tco_0981330 [Tanacetum coccineum]
METSKPLLKDAEAKDVDVHLYRLMIGSLVYLIASRPNIMFAIYACARFQVTPKGSHLHAMKRIFRYLKGQPKLGLWYPKDSSFDLEAYTDNDYVGPSLNRKSTTGVKNPVFYSKIKHIEIRHHFIRDSNEKKHIQIIKIYTDLNVADLLKKAFNVGRFQYLTATADDAIQVSVVGLTYYCNYEVTCEEEAKKRNTRALMKIFEEYCKLLPYTVSNKEDTTLIRRQKGIAMGEPITKEYISATSKSFISNDINGKMIEKNFIKIEGTFLLRIHDNTFHRNEGEDVFKHINSFLEVVEPLKIRGLSHDRFRLSVFTTSLSGAAKEWFTNECISTISTWDNLVENFVLKFCNLCKHEEREETNDPDVIDDVPEIFNQ